MALDNGKKFAGAVTAGWHAFNITSDQGSGIGGWSDDEVFAYLATGHALGSRHSGGPHGRSRRSKFQPDVRHPTFVRWSAMCAAFRPSLRPTYQRRSHCQRRLRLRTAVRRRIRSAKRSSKQSCVSCHNWTGVSAITPYATVAGAARGQRPHRHQCCPDRDFRNEAAHAVRRCVDAGLWPHALRLRNSRRQQLCRRRGFGSARSDITDKDVAESAISDIPMT